MRTVNLFLITLVLCAEAFGQVYENYHYENYQTSIPGPVQASTVQMPDHSQPIVQRNLFANSSAGFAHGERPAWEILGLPQPRPLGDVARDYRKEHEKAKKATIVWEP
jgi:hypothetical protein